MTYAFAIMRRRRTTPPENRVPDIAVSISPGSGAAGVNVFTANVTGDRGFPASILTYQWKAGGVDIEGAVSATYSPSEAIAALTVSVTATNTSGSDIATSAAVEVVEAPEAWAPTGISVSVSPGSGEVGDTFTANVTGNLGSPEGTIAYQWALGGVDIGGATSATYLTTAAGNLTVSVTVTNTEGYDSDTSGTVEVAEATPAAWAPSGIAASISPSSGTAGDTFTANVTGDLGSPEGTITYQWKRGGSNISGATSATYVSDAGADAGVNLTVSVSVSNTEGSDSDTSSAVAVAIPLRAPSGIAVSISPSSGTAGVSTFTANVTGDLGNPAGTIAYQWKRDGANISGATASTYVSDAEDDSDISLTVSVNVSNTEGSDNDTSSAVTVADAGTPMTIMERFYDIGGVPAYVHPSTAYVTEAQGKVTSASGWAKQNESAGITINTTDGKIEFAANVTQQIARLTLATPIPNGTAVHVQVGAVGSSPFVVRLGPTNQNAGTGAIHEWKSNVITTNSEKTYLEIVQNANGDAMSFTGICVEPFDLAAQEFDIYILAGQSNMAGASSGSGPDRAIEIPHPDVFARWGSTQAAHWVTDGGISRARESFIMKANNLAVSPGLHIGRYLAEHHLETGRKILLIGSAQGGTSLLQSGGGWNPTGSSPTLVNDMIADALAAKALNAGNEIKGVFWCQGESDRGAGGASGYIAKFPDFVDYVRDELGEAALPFCIMGLNPFRSGGLAADTNTTEMIDAQTSLAEGEPNGITGVCYAGYSPAWPNGTKPLPSDSDDEVHFGTEANRLRGVHAARTFVDFLGGGSSVSGYSDGYSDGYGA